MFLVFFLAILLSGLALITGLILGISGLASDQPRMRNAGFITLGIAAIALAASIYFAVTGVVRSVKENIMEPMMSLRDSLEKLPENNQNSLLDDNRYYLISDTCTNKQIAYIKEESFKKEERVNNSFYTYFGGQGFARMPLIYPYAIHCLDSKDIGTLVDESKVVDIALEPGKEENIVFNVIAVNYNENMVLMKTEKLDPGVNKTIESFTMYSEKDKKINEYKTEEALFKAAVKAGYKGQKKLIGLWDYDAMF